MASPDRLNATLKFHCSEHPSRYIEGVDFTASENKQVYCLVCILQNPDAHNLYLSLQTFPTFLEKSAALFAEEKARAMAVPNPPREYLQLMSSKDQNIARLKMRLNDQKRKFESCTQELKNLLVQAIEKRKVQFFGELDDHLNNYVDKYQELEKMLSVCYPRAEDLDELFPSKEVLEKSFRSTRSTSDIEQFVKKTKIDLEENKKKISLSLQDDEYKVTQLEPLKRELFVIENTNKDFQHEIENIHKEIRSSTDQQIDLLSPTSAAQASGLFPSGDINMTPEDFSVIKGWLPDEYSSNFNPQLLYKGITDGLTPEAFHSRCDGKGPTLTIIKGMFLGSAEMTVLGGFLDKDWNSKNAWIASDQAFIFSLTAQIKCPVTVTGRAAYGAANRGPAFGYGHDIMIAENLSKSYMSPQSYANAGKLVKSAAYTGSGTIHFTPYDVEVYSLSV